MLVKWPGSTGMMAYLFRKIFRICLNLRVPSYTLELPVEAAQRHPIRKWHSDLLLLLAPLKVLQG
jgi:hypothetical protein